jgi:hypothetical protein
VGVRMRLRLQMKSARICVQAAVAHAMVMEAR